MHLGLHTIHQLTVLVGRWVFLGKNHELMDGVHPKVREFLPQNIHLCTNRVLSEPSLAPWPRAH